jgi:hypothetical protein
MTSMNPAFLGLLSAEPGLQAGLDVSRPRLLGKHDDCLSLVGDHQGHHAVDASSATCGPAPAERFRIPYTCRRRCACARRVLTLW